MGARAANLGYLCAEAARRDPDSIAYIELGKGSERRCSFGELDEKMDRIAGYLLSAGLERGSRIAIGVGNRIEFVIALFGSMRAGFVPVPMNVRLGRDALAHIIKDADCKAAIVEPTVHPDLTGIVNDLDVPVRLALDNAIQGWLGFDQCLEAAEPLDTPPDLPKDYPAMQPYTSGSTGKPKGVVLTHAGQAWFVENFVRQLPELYHSGTRALVAVPLFHKNAMAGIIKPLLKIGAPAVLLRDFHPETYIRAMADYACTYSSGVPAMYSKLLECRELLSRTEFPALEYLSIGSAPCAPALVEEIEHRFNARVLQGYGLTEGGPVVLEQCPGDTDAPVESCGRVLDGVEVRLVDENGNDSLQGELWVKNPGVTPGYHNLPEINAARISDGWLATGDLFRADDQGNYYFLGRTDDLMITGGENVYPAEVEKILMRHPDVLNICVVSLPHAVKGEVPGAMVVLESGSPLDERALKQFFLSEGPAYAHPRRILITETMPLNGAGKIERARVRVSLLDGWEENGGRAL